MKRAYFLMIPVLMAAPLLVDILAELKTNEEKVKSVFVASLGDGLLQVESDIVKAARALPEGVRAEGIRQLIHIAKDYSQTESFAKAYSRWRDERLGYKQKQRGLRLPKLSNLAEKAVDKQLNKADDEKKYPGDPNEMIRNRLQEFLDLSATVDFDAKLSGAMFVNPAYEAKSNQWKMCYRAGKAVTEAARDEAAKWLKELK